MRNALILGSGRSGTSLVAGTLAKAGYFMGSHLWAPDAGNPKGYFEDEEVNRINEDILTSVVPERPPNPRIKWLVRDTMGYWERWVAALPLRARITASPEIERRIQKVVSRVPFCFKDPRLSYTLPKWQPFLQSRDVVFVVVFRHPLPCAESMLKEVHAKHPLLAFDRRSALAVWESMYSHIVKMHYPRGAARGERWLFLRYEELLGSDGALKKLSRELDAPIDESFPDAKLNRSRARSFTLPRSIVELYEKLCSLAHSEPYDAAPPLA